MSGQRYRVVFTPVGWHVIDTSVARDPVAQFGTGREEYNRAREECDRINKEVGATARAVLSAREEGADTR